MNLGGESMQRTAPSLERRERFMPLWQYYREEFNRVPLGHETRDLHTSKLLSTEEGGSLSGQRELVKGQFISILVIVDAHRLRTIPLPGI